MGPVVEAKRYPFGAFAAPMTDQPAAGSVVTKSSGVRPAELRTTRSAPPNVGSPADPRAGTTTSFAVGSRFVTERKLRSRPFGLIGLVTSSLSVSDDVRMSRSVGTTVVVVVFELTVV